LSSAVTDKILLGTRLLINMPEMR